MKLGNDEIKKIGLGAMAVGGVTFVYFTFLLGPLQDGKKATQASIDATKPKIEAANAQIKKTAELEKTAPAASLTLKQLCALIPEGSPVAWFPTQVGDFFKREGIEKVTTVVVGDSPDKELAGFKRISWTIRAPRVEFPAFTQTIADFENEELLVEISSIRLESMRNDPEGQSVLLTVNNVVK